jgi:hypothetical protein
MRTTMETTVTGTKRPRAVWHPAPSHANAAPAEREQPTPEGGEASPEDSALNAFGESPTDSRLAEDECEALHYPAGTEWRTFTDDELERFVEYVYRQIGLCEVETRAWGQAGGSGWWSAYDFGFERLEAIAAHRGAAWLDPIAKRLREHWDDVIAAEKAGSEAERIAEDRAAALFPDNPEAREALMEIMVAELTP